MSGDTQELLSIEQLPEAKRVEVTDFNRFLLAKDQSAAPKGAMEQWLAGARGAAPGVTTDEVIGLTRGD